METAFSLGSNLGDRLARLAEARRRLTEDPAVRLAAQSPVYETEPVGVKEAYRELEFLNAVIVLESPYDARAWLARIKSIESAMGRVREEDRNAPRPIDIDILYADRQCIDDRGLTVPHPRWARRRFVLRPLADVRPDLTLPGMDRTVADVLASLPPGEDVRPFADAGW